MIYKGKAEEYLDIKPIHGTNCLKQTEPMDSVLTFLWFQEQSKMTVDSVEYTFSVNDIVCLTEFHNASMEGLCKAKMIRFNRQFYCIKDHDSEVGCKGILFFGASQLPRFTIPNGSLEVFETIWKMFEMEMQSTDKLQLEMLQSMLKRFMILCTRTYKNQHHYDQMGSGQIDIIREYNFLVEQHFKEKHAVSDYAMMLNKSPKTLSNLFSKLSDKTPLQYIKERRLLEAKRLLQYSDMSINEIAFDIGFDDVQSFSRFFKKMEGLPPSRYKNLVH